MTRWFRQSQADEALREESLHTSVRRILDTQSGMSLALARIDERTRRMTADLTALDATVSGVAQAVAEARQRQIDTAKTFQDTLDTLRAQNAQLLAASQSSPQQDFSPEIAQLDAALADAQSIAAATVSEAAGVTPTDGATGTDPAQQ